MPKEITEIRTVEPEDTGAPSLDDAFAASEKSLEEALGAPAPELTEVLPVVEEESADSVPSDEGAKPATEPTPDIEPEPEVEVEEPEPEVEEVAAEEPEVETEPEGEPVEMEAVELTTMVDGEERSVEIEVEDPDTAATLRALQAEAEEGRDIASRADEARGMLYDAQEERARAEFMLQQIATDPSGYIVDGIKDPATKAQVVINALHDDHVLQAVTDKLEEWSLDAGVRRRESNELQANQREARSRLETQYQQGQQQREMTRKVIEAIVSEIPEDMERGLADKFYEDSIADVTKHVRQNGGQLRGEVKDIIAPRLKLYGVQAAKNGKKATAKVRPAKEVGEELVAAKQRRQAASTPVGAGAEPAGRSPPKGLNLKQAFEWAEGKG